MLTDSLSCLMTIFIQHRISFYFSSRIIPCCLKNQSSTYGAQRIELHSGKKMFWNGKMLSGKAWNSSGNHGHKSRINSMSAQHFLVAACWEEESHVICDGGFFCQEEC